MPPWLDAVAFAELAGERYNPFFFSAFADPISNLISTDIVLAEARRTDVYVSYAWGRDSHRRRTRDRLARIVAHLRRRGFVVHFDDHADTYALPHADTAQCIDNAQVFLSCVTANYVERVNRSNGVKPNKNSFEFNHALHSKADRMVFLLMDESALDAEAWRGRLARVAQLTEACPLVDCSKDGDGEAERQAWAVGAALDALATPLMRQTYGAASGVPAQAEAQALLGGRKGAPSPMLTHTEPVVARAAELVRLALRADAPAAPAINSPMPSSSSSRFSPSRPPPLSPGPPALHPPPTPAFLHVDADAYYERLGHMEHEALALHRGDSASHALLRAQVQMPSHTARRITHVYPTYPPPTPLQRPKLQTAAFSPGSGSGSASPTTRGQLRKVSSWRSRKRRDSARGQGPSADGGGG
jgi:hypothetical protein